MHKDTYIQTHTNTHTHADTRAHTHTPACPGAASRRKQLRGEDEREERNRRMREERR